MPCPKPEWESAAASRRKMIKAALSSLASMSLAGCGTDSPVEPEQASNASPSVAEPSPTSATPTPTPAAPAPEPTAPSGPVPPPGSPAPAPATTPMPPVPAWRSAMRPFTWAPVSNSKLSDVDPAKDPAINPNMADAPWRGSDGQHGVIAAWGSAVWDDENRRLWVPIGGGHGNYAGNECYVTALGTADPRWTMPRAPTGAIGNRVALLADGKEATSTYADGRPRSIHPYNDVCYAKGVGPVITRISAPYADSNVNTHRAFCLDPTTGETRLVFDFADPAQTGFPAGRAYGYGTGGAVNAACCYDPVRNRVVTVGIGNAVHVLWCTPSTAPGLWRGGHLPTMIGPSGGSAQALVYLPERDRYLHLVPWLGKIYHKLIHPETGALTDLGPIWGDVAPGLDLDTMTGAAWAPELGRVLLWNQRSNTARISTLADPGNLVSAWVAGTLELSGDNAVVPPAQHGNGTFGLFGYSSSLRGCYLITSNEAPVMFFATQ